MTTCLTDEFYFTEEREGIKAEGMLEKDFNINELNNIYADNEELAYTVTMLLRYFDEHNEGTTTKTRFNKLIYIINEELIKENIDIRLPYFWYLYGPVTPLNFLPNGLIKLINKPWGEGIKIDAYRNFKLSDIIKTKIDAAVRSTHHAYGNYEPKIMTGKIITSVYNVAPYPFQTNYKLFQYQIKRKLRDRAILRMLGPLKEANDITNLNELVRAYSKNDFPDIYKDLLQWKLLVYHQLKNLSSIDGRILTKLLDTYWHVFCQLLKARCNNYLPEPLVIKWKQQIPAEINNYRLIFKKIEDDFYSSEYVSNNSLNIKLLNAYNSTVIQRVRRNNE